MNLHITSRIFVIGGTGAQGMPIVRALVADGKYTVSVLTRDLQSKRACELLSLPGVSLFEGSFANEATLREGFSRCNGAFVNIDGFNAGEKSETYWAIRAYELAVEAGVKFFVYGNLDYALKTAGYDSKFRTGHYDGKGRIGEWIRYQNRANESRMGAAIFTSGPYMEMAISAMTPMSPRVEDGIVTWRVPLGDGAVPHVALQDCGYYVRWLFDHPELANGMDLQVAIEHVSYAKLAAAFEKVTGRPARYVDTDLDAYWNGPFGRIGNLPAGYNADPDDKSTMNVRDNFTGFWNLWKQNIVTRNYALLDEIHPNRIRSVEEWLRREDLTGRQTGMGTLWERVQAGKIQQILKLTEDMMKGAL